MSLAAFHPTCIAPLHNIGLLIAEDSQIRNAISGKRGNSLVARMMDGGATDTGITLCENGTLR
ncbi:hypothetical protein NS14008_09770 [Nocardia seriolae]|nr:hypothetical protein NS14008_09770 [Nocardia seriolae]